MRHIAEHAVGCPCGHIFSATQARRFGTDVWCPKCGHGPMDAAAELSSVPGQERKTARVMFGDAQTSRIRPTRLTLPKRDEFAEEEARQLASTQAEEYYQGR